MRLVCFELVVFAAEIAGLLYDAHNKTGITPP